MVSSKLAGALFLGAATACSAAGSSPLGAEEGEVNPATEPTSTSNTTTGSTPLPCDISAIFSSYCHQCHGPVPMAAPMALVTWEDVQAASKLVAGEQIAERLRARLNDPVQPMPPPSVVQFPTDYRDRINAWVDAGAPRGDGTACGLPPTSSGEPIAPPPSTAGPPPALPPGEEQPVVPPSLTPQPPAPGECNPVQFRAHAPGGADPFPVPTNTVDRYHCFYFKAPWPNQVQALSFVPIIDNPAVIHHWLLYSVSTPHPDGSSEDCVGTHPDGFLLAGWAPNASPWFMPPDVGMEIPWGPDGYMMLEVHYNNFGASATDSSGVEVCATENLRPNTASISWLGTEAIFLLPGAGSAVGTCAPSMQAPITILRSWPHMHTFGKRMHAEIQRAGGTIEPLFDVPFDFNFQYAYDTPAILNPGDSIVTTCDYYNTAPFTTFGPGTSQEMCYNFVVAYPARTLVSTGLLHRNACIQ